MWIFYSSGRSQKWVWVWYVNFSKFSFDPILTSVSKSMCKLDNFVWKYCFWHKTRRGYLKQACSDYAKDFEKTNKNNVYCICIKHNYIQNQTQYKWRLLNSESIISYTYRWDDKKIKNQFINNYLFINQSFGWSTNARTHM